MNSHSQERYDQEETQALERYAQLKAKAEQMDLPLELVLAKYIFALEQRIGRISRNG